MKNNEKNKSYNDTMEDLNIMNVLSNSDNKKSDIKKNEPYDEPGHYHDIGVLCFSTATLLLGISIWNGFKNGKLLTIFGFFIGGLGQLVSGFYCYKFHYYIDGTVYFFFALNWGITTCYDFFPIWGWMEPLTSKEYGYHFLMGCFFTLIFMLQNWGSPSYFIKISFTTTFLGFVYSTIGNFCENKALLKIGGILNIITAALAYISIFINILSERYKGLIQLYKEKRPKGNIGKMQ